MADIKLTANVVIANGPSIATSRALALGGYDRIDITVPNGQSKDVELQPGGAGRVQLLFVTSSLYDDKLTYKINGGADTFALDQPLMLAGHGAIMLFTDPPTKLSFNNATTGNNAGDAIVEILVGRNVGP